MTFAGNSKLTLGDLCRFQAGSAFPQEYQGAISGDFPFIKVSDMNLGGNEVHINEANNWVSTDQLGELKAKPLPAGTPVFAKIGEALKQNRVRLLTRATIIDNNMMGALANADVIDRRYLYYLLGQIGLPGLATGTSVPYLTVNVLFRVLVDLPLLPTQRKIVSILSVYDDLIENNSRRIKILEEMAQTIYQEWFVKFRFPGHEKVRMVDSPLGKIPEGWEVKKLKNLVSNIKQSEKSGNHLLKIPYVPIDCLPRKSLYLNTSKPGSEAKSSLIRFKKYDVLFGAMRSYFHKVVIAPFNGTTRTTCFILRPNDSNYYAYSVLTLFQESTINYANNHSKGSTMPYAVWDEGLAEMSVILPPKDIVTRFNESIEPMLKRITVGYFEQKNLRQTRDLLLPKLISGEIDVEDLDIDVGELVE